VLDGLGAHDEQVADHADFTPIGADLVVLRKPAEVDQLALARDLSKGGAIVLAKGNNLSTILGRPAPRRRAASAPAAELSVREEVVQVNL
jgi:hypothetical protein